MKKPVFTAKKQKKDSEFNKEHVISQSFGKFLQNLTLHVVCTKCNTYFSRKLESALGRDSSLGLLYRGLLGLLDSNTFPRAIKHRRRDTETVIYDDNKGELIVDISINERRNFDVTIASQAIIMNSLKAKQVSFRLDNMLHRNSIENLGLNPVNGYIKIFCPLNDYKKQADKINMIFQKSDINFKIHADQLAKSKLSSNGPLYFKNRISGLVARALAKIVFNYFVHQYGQVALGESFNEIRNFIRYDRMPDYDIISIKQWKIPDFQSIQDVKHARYEVSIKKDHKNNIIGTMLLFKNVLCEVILARTFILELPNKETLFEINNRNITHF